MLKEYPRPQFRRGEWLNLNGEWRFDYDDNNEGLAKRWYQGKELSRKINVPYVFESKLSGIGEQDPHKYVWYAKRLEIPAAWRGRRVFLRFGAVDYAAKVFVSGCFAGEHTGGNTAFEVEITDFLTYEEDIVYVYAADDPQNEFQARGKQFWEDVPRDIWYPRSTGIWQSVYLECRGERYITGYEAYPDVDAGRARFIVDIDAFEPGMELGIEITLEGETVSSLRTEVLSGTVDIELDVFHKRVMASPVHGMGLCWSPENPVLFDLAFTLSRRGKQLDRVDSYFGMRKIRVENGEIFLNNHRYVMRLVLNQGYYRDGLLTPESDEAMAEDILLCKRMGFNGCRMHQKVECELFHYYADKFGFLVWGEIASCANFRASAAAAFENEWAESLRQRFNHPSVAVWVPVNESWGAPNLRESEQQRHLLSSVYHLTKMLDPTRPVISNDGWEMTETDIIAIHNYAHGRQGDGAQHAKYADSIRTREALLTRPSTNRDIFVGRHGDGGQPILLTEMGGASFGEYDGERYGYSDVGNGEEFLAFLRRVFGAVYASEALKGFCYTQFADVEQEINGLVTEDRVPKAAAEEISKIVRGEM